MIRTFIALSFVALFGFVGRLAFYAYAPVGGESQSVDFLVSPGSSFHVVSKKLEESGLVRSPLEFKVVAKLFGFTQSIRVGEYSLDASMSPLTILKTLSSGISKTYSLTIPEGLNMYEIANLIEQKGYGRADTFLELCQNQAYIKQLTGQALPSLEGYLFPETYLITRFTKEQDLVQLMFENFKNTFSEVQGRGEALGLSDHEVVILASIIEKETGAPFERALISSVFHNRLKKGMRLQTDPTVIYGVLDRTGQMTKNITKKDLKTKDRYNTYTFKGLPFGPIANPGQQALQAAVQPKESDYLFFVSRNDGTHVFTTKYSDHQQAVQKFQLDRSMRQGRSWRDLNKKAN